VIDILTLALTHGLMALAAITLLSRDELDEENGGSAPSKPWQRNKAAAGDASRPAGDS
jgi:hypothetical protein